VFAVGKQSQVSVLDESPPDAQRKVVEQAVRYCPTHALRIEEG
jgi:ferredoxin